MDTRRVFFAHLMEASGHQVWGTSRNVSALKHSVPAGVEIIGFNHEEILRCMEGTTCFLISTPPNDSGHDSSFSIMKELILERKKQCHWIGYLSSTGVYGDHQGAWVDESSQCLAESNRAKKRVLAEKSWLSLYEVEGLPVNVFRLSGIYGPGRNAIERIRAGKNTSVLKEAQYFSRIHVTDICEALFQSMLLPMPGEIFNLSDDYPCNSCEVDAYAADLLGVERLIVIPYEVAELSPMAQEFYQSNRRVSNAKLKKTLLPKLRYPTYKEGLDSIL